MVKKASHIFRKEALKRLNSPERLDTRMEVVGRRGWLPLTAAFLVLTMFVVWSIYGMIPLKAVGRGILVRPNKTLSVNSPAQGVVALVEVKEGAEVKVGQVLATLDLPELRLQLAQERERLERLKADHAAEGRLAERRIALERETQSLRRGAIEAKVAKDHAFLTRIKKIELGNLERQQSVLSQRLRMRTELVAALKQHYDHQTMGEDTIEQDVVKAREAWVEAIADADAIEDEIELILQKEAELLRGHQTLSEEITALRDELSQLDLNQRKLEQEEQTRLAANGAEIRTTEASIASLELSLKRLVIVSPKAGRVLELRVSAGQFLALGEVVALIEVGDTKQTVSCLAFMPARSGKRMFSAMEVLVSPDTVERERFGGIVGEVKEVGRYPMTTEAAAKWLGNKELAEELLEGQTAIMVLVDLARDPKGAGGYLWSSSQGPSHEVSTWTTCSVEVVLEKRAPITLALPFLKSLIN